MNLLQQVQHLLIELETVKDDSKILKLEIFEYQKEITNLKHKYGQLVEENMTLSEQIKIEQQNSFHARSFSDENVLINSRNADLTAQISDYKKLASELNTQYKNLQTENAKYKITLKQLTEQQQQKHKTHTDEMLKLENKLKELENECETLRNTNTNTHLQIEQNNVNFYENIKFAPSYNQLLSRSNYNLMRIKSIKTCEDTYTPNVLYSELKIHATGSYSDLRSPLYKSNGNGINKLKRINDENQSIIYKLQNRIEYLKEFIYAEETKKSCEWSSVYSAGVLLFLWNSFA
eukprot:987491_1